MDWDTWVQLVWDVLLTDDQVCWSLIRAAGGKAAEVMLIDGSATASDALAYARTLAELGHTFEAREIFGAVVRAAFEFAATVPRMA